MTTFTGKIALVTGATRGIGRAIAELFLAGGATVLGTYAADAAAAERFQCEAGNGRLHLFRCDVADAAAVAGLYETVEKEFGGLHILVCNAGIRKDGFVATLDPGDWQRVIDVNLTGTFLMARHAAWLMRRNKFGRIVFITSPMAHLGFAGVGNYAASKAGQIGLMKSLSKEVAKRGITVNCVAPGFIETELLAGLNDEQLAEYRKLIPFRRFGTAREVAEAVAFLASGQAAYISGSVLEVTGGL